MIDGKQNLHLRTSASGDDGRPLTVEGEVGSRMLPRHVVVEGRETPAAGRSGIGGVEKEHRRFRRRDDILEAGGCVAARELHAGNPVEELPDLHLAGELHEAKRPEDIAPAKPRELIAKQLPENYAVTVEEHSSAVLLELDSIDEVTAFPALELILERKPQSLGFSARAPSPPAVGAAAAAVAPAADAASALRSRCLLGPSGLLESPANSPAHRRKGIRGNAGGPGLGPELCGDVPAWPPEPRSEVGQGHAATCGERGRRRRGSTVGGDTVGVRGGVRLAGRRVAEKLELGAEAEGHIPRFRGQPDELGFAKQAIEISRGIPGDTCRKDRLLPELRAHRVEQQRLEGPLETLGSTARLGDALPGGEEGYDVGGGPRDHGRSLRCPKTAEQPFEVLDVTDPTPGIVSHDDLVGEDPVRDERGNQRIDILRRQEQVSGYCLDGARNLVAHAADDYRLYRRLAGFLRTLGGLGSYCGREQRGGGVLTRGRAAGCTGGGYRRPGGRVLGPLNRLDDQIFGPAPPGSAEPRHLFGGGYERLDAIGRPDAVCFSRVAGRPGNVRPPHANDARAGFREQLIGCADCVPEVQAVPASRLQELLPLRRSEHGAFCDPLDEPPGVSGCVAAFGALQAPAELFDDVGREGRPQRRRQQTSANRLLGYRRRGGLHAGVGFVDTGVRGLPQEVPREG